MKKAFITGLVILLPVAITLMLVTFVLNILASPFSNVVSSLLQKFGPFSSFPILTSILAKIIILILFGLFLLLLGYLASKIFSRALLNSFHSLLMKIPLFNSIYNIAKDLISTLISSEGDKSFKNPVLLDFPNRESATLGFLSKPVAKQIQTKFDKEMVAIFVPSSPQPISGYLLFAFKDDVKNIEMSKEEALKFTVSCAIITPPQFNQDIK